MSIVMPKMRKVGRKRRASQLCPRHTKEDSTQWWWVTVYLVGWVGFLGFAGTPYFQMGRDVGSGQQGQAAPGYLFCENFCGFSFLEGIFELFHFKELKYPFSWA